MTQVYTAFLPREASAPFTKLKSIWWNLVFHWFHHLLALQKVFPQGRLTLEEDLHVAGWSVPWVSAPFPSFLYWASCSFFWGGGGSHPPLALSSALLNPFLWKTFYMWDMCTKIYESRKENITNFLKPDVKIGFNRLLKHHIPFLTPNPYLIICPKKMPHGDPQSWRQHPPLLHLWRPNAGGPH